MNLELQTLSVKNNQPLHKFFLDNFYDLLLTFWKLSNMILCQIQQRGDRKIGELLAYKNLIKRSICTVNLTFCRSSSERTVESLVTVQSWK